jgi:predicted nucleic acid-binding protein
MQEPLVFDSTPLIHLTRFSLASAFKEISGEKFTTTKVFNEVVQHGKKRGAPEASILEGLFKEEVIKIRNPSNIEFVKSVKEMAAELERQPLHEAEAEVLCLSKELDGIVIADDKVARAVAKLLNIEIHGTGYILGRIFAAGKIKKEQMIEKVNEMRDGGWHVSAEDYLRIIEYLKKL